MYHNQGQWRNPYAVKPKKKSAPKSVQPVEVIAPKNETKSMKDSLVKVREQFKGIREQLHQMESAMETLYNVMDAMERFGSGAGTKVKNQGNLLKSFNNIDFKQVMNLLQSPLVQALIETMAEEEPKGKKSTSKQ
jgi:prophage DNA circulation protein